MPPIKGLDQINYLTSDNLWSLRELPKKLVVLGGGPIGSEMTQAFARLGSHVTQIEMASRIVAREDPEVGEYLQQQFTSEGIQVLTQHRAQEVRIENDQKWLVCEHQGETVEIEFDQILIAVGRQANVTGFGLEELGVKISPRGTVSAILSCKPIFPIFSVPETSLAPTSLPILPHIKPGMRPSTLYLGSSKALKSITG